MAKATKKNKDVGLNVEAMGVAITFVFADEAHREAWLHRNELLEDDGMFADYVSRQSEANLLYFIGAEEGLTQEEEETMQERLAALHQTLLEDSEDSDD